VQWKHTTVVGGRVVGNREVRGSGAAMGENLSLGGGTSFQGQLLEQCLWSRFFSSNRSNGRMDTEARRGSYQEKKKN